MSAPIDPNAHPLFQKLEPEADHGIDPHHAMLASIAVSLKRIADVLVWSRIHDGYDPR